MTSARWIVRASGPSRPMRLYCFPYAGGSANSFLPWQTGLSDKVELCAIQLPGRAARRLEAPMSSMREVVEKVSRAIMEEGHDSFAFFGHSLGALLAFEVARYCMLNGFPVPLRLFVSGSAAPQFRSAPRGLHLLSDDALIATLKTYNGTPSELLANRELMELVLPMLRADFSLVENYAYRPAPLLQMPMTVLAGRLDDRVDPTQVDGWRRETSADTNVEWFDGDHFFINSHRQAVLDCVDATLQNLLCV